MKLYFYLILIILFPFVIGDEIQIGSRQIDESLVLVKRTLPTVDEIFSTLPVKSDRVTTHDYGAFYTRHLHQFRTSSQPLNILEIGLGCGMPYGPGVSIPFWLHPDLFPKASVKLFIMEVDRICVQQWRQSGPHSKHSNVFVHVGDQGFHLDLHALLKQSGPFDIIVDDGGHLMAQQQSSLIYLFHNGLKFGGVYFLEDYGTSSDPNYNPTDVTTTADVTVKWTRQLLRAEHSPKPTVPELNHLEAISCGFEVCAFFKSDVISSSSVSSLIFPSQRPIT